MSLGRREEDVGCPFVPKLKAEAEAPTPSDSLNQVNKAEHPQPPDRLP